MKILHLDDDPADAELFGQLIREEWPHCEIDGVWAPEAYVARLGGQRYDLILSEFSIAGFDGLRALQIARQTAPETPFIFLSDTISEHRAVEAVRLGAAGCVQKDQAKRLIPAIRAALARAGQARDKGAGPAGGGP